MKGLNQFSVISSGRVKTLWPFGCALRTRWRECCLSHLYFLFSIALLLGQSAKAGEEQACPPSSEVEQASGPGVEQQVCETVLEPTEGGLDDDYNPLSFEAIDAHRAALKADRLEANQFAADEMMREGANQAGANRGVQATAAPKASQDR